MTKKTYQVLYCGPMARPGMPAKGGYQACNRRTVKALKENGVIVRILPYPEPGVGGLKKYMLYLIGFCALFLRIIACGKPRYIFHLTGLYKYFIPIELIMITIAKLKGCNIIYDIRAGSAIRYFESGGKIYKTLFITALQRSDLIFVEGEVYINFIKKISGKTPLYFPNHLDIETLEKEDNNRNISTIPKLVYVGRVAAEKGITVIIDASFILDSRGIKNDVVIIGDGEDEYMKLLKDRCQQKSVKFTGPLNFKSLAHELVTSHFFVFPSSHTGEGHSNALTEAMAFGCVPIASDNGFNRSIIGECGFVISNSTEPELFANAIFDIWNNDQWKKFSGKCESRIKMSFSTNKVIKNLIENYNSIVSLKK